MKLRVKLDTRQVINQFKAAEDIPTDLIERSYKKFKDLTPIRTGNARQNTKLEKTTILGDYPYAQRLDKGYSQQAPDGMSEPTIAYMERELDQLVRKVK